jgi:hypothetical protein
MVVIRGSEITEVEVPPNGAVQMPATSSPSIAPPAAEDTESSKEDETGSSDATANGGADDL